MGRDSRTSRRWALAALVLVAGCGGASVGDEDDGADPITLDAAQVCPGGSVREEVVVCTQLRPEGDPLSLPADGGDVVYGALAPGGDRFLTRDSSLELSSSVVEALQDDVDRSAARSADSGAAEDGDVASRSGPYAQLVYRAQVQDRTVTALTPAVRVDETALMTRVFGGTALEGTIAPLVSQDEGYELEATLPVRIELADVAADAVIGGRIVNATQSVLMSTGTCAPALSDAGARAPLQDSFTETVELQRYPSMHAPFDDELLLKWNDDVSSMGGELFPSAATLLRQEPPAATWETSLHGNPTAGPAMTLALVEGGGGSC